MCNASLGDNVILNSFFRVSDLCAPVSGIYLFILFILIAQIAGNNQKKEHECCSV